MCEEISSQIDADRTLYMSWGLQGCKETVNTARRVEERSEHCQEKGGGEESLNWLLANSYCSCSMATLKLLPGTVNSLLVELLQVLIQTNTNNIINPS